MFYYNSDFSYFELEIDVNRSERISAADMQSICQEAGMQAVRKNR